MSVEFAFPERSRHRSPVVLFDYVVGNVLLGAIQEARLLGWRLINLEATEHYIPKGCDPIGAVVGLPSDHPAISQIADLDIPLVRVGQLPHDRDVNVPAVIPDYIRAGRIAAGYYLDRHFEHLAYFGRNDILRNKPLCDGFTEKAREYGKTTHCLHLSNLKAKSKADAYANQSRQIREWLSDLPKPVGLLTLNDKSGVFCEAICDTLGISVPEEVAIIGIGNLGDLCETAPVELSSIDLGEHKQGEEAIRLLNCLVNGTPIQESPVVVAPVGIKERHSVSLVAVADPVVAKALTYIWDNLDLQISVTEIATHVGVSRRLLERRFKRTLGRGVNEERIRRRLEYSAELLTGTKMAVADIATAAGFPSRSHLYRVFKRRYSISPGDYRKQKVPTDKVAGSPESPKG